MPWTPSSEDRKLMTMKRRKRELRWFPTLGRKRPKPHEHGVIGFDSYDRQIMWAPASSPELARELFQETVDTFLPLPGYERLELYEAGVRVRTVAKDSAEDR
jgi:hypothetical protein